MRINKILNNNAVVVKESGHEKIVMGNGIAFQKKKNDIITKTKIEKIFVMKEGNQKFQDLLTTLPEEHIEIAEEVISYAEGQLQVPLNDHIHIALSDHISFAIERFRQGYPIQNKLLNEIKTLYKEEFSIGVWARNLINERLELDMPIDEAGHIALHIHTAKIHTKNMHHALEQTTMINEVIQLIERKLNQKLDEEGISYQRLVTHIRFALNRIETKQPFHTMDAEMLAMIEEKYQQAYTIAAQVSAYLKDEYQVKFPVSEIGYISLHIQRLMEKV
ncbi:PRD domain-containing protein [Desertibacillus haloalkaliphilus]|uniref:PRD domain-containing protein n=1 Tax=Desertibacillus haloalkaliphilus TaxID=1328930 RepID=UPI001C2640D9|nr:PRD domain-containing protein [Desertibacillus haloalkaliphilus]MBU8905308.1 PRD domain-containing protein [Desertibacillus haloalkaliphilus]